MPHPLAGEFAKIANPIARALGLELVNVVFYTNQNPPVMRLDIRQLDRERDTSHADCEAMSRALGTRLEQDDPIPGAYLLEISSPGLSQYLSSDRDFEVFKGFSVAVTLSAPFKGQTEWTGRLQKRDPDWVWLSQKGRPVKLPRADAQQVKLLDGETP
ncbi:ribosome maturation factor RimP [Synechococcus sp. PCC 7336]|uniref:ribosome maturation factor RimP n=1 Tax=Synechococcus sp. PCC 7336 TaxID=195250 RepID=UPI000348DE75|nr:ribosome maturation factor RimP [Synechococcus sp. PCC 7336]